MFNSTHQMKLVVRPPSKITRMTGSPTHNGPVPWLAEILVMGSPNSKPYEKQELITPENVAMASPFHRLNSVMAEDFPSLPMSLSLRTPATPPIAMPTRQTMTPKKQMLPPCVCNSFAAN